MTICCSFPHFSLRFSKHLYLFTVHSSSLCLWFFALTPGKQAENVFGELFNEANTFYVRANSLQDRIDRLAVKVTQLDSSVEEGLSANTVSYPVYFCMLCIKLSTSALVFYSHSSGHKHEEGVQKFYCPGPAGFVQGQHSELCYWHVQHQRQASSSQYPHCIQVMHVLLKNATSNQFAFSSKVSYWKLVFKYREDSIDAMKFYSDPSYFFDLWKEKMLQDTEDKRKEKRKQRVRVHPSAFCSHIYMSSCSFFVSSFTFPRNRSGVWKAVPFSARWRRWGRLETADRSGTWWPSIKSFVQITTTHRFFGEALLLRDHSLQMAGENFSTESRKATKVWCWYVLCCFGFHCKIIYNPSIVLLVWWCQMFWVLPVKCQGKPWISKKTNEDAGYIF